MGRRWQRWANRAGVVATILAAVGGPYAGYRHAQKTRKTTLAHAEYVDVLSRAHGEARRSFTREEKLRSVRHGGAAYRAIFPNKTLHEFSRILNLMPKESWGLATGLVSEMAERYKRKNGRELGITALEELQRTNPGVKLPTIDELVKDPKLFDMLIGQAVHDLAFGAVVDKVSLSNWETESFFTPADRRTLNTMLDLIPDRKLEVIEDAVHNMDVAENARVRKWTAGSALLTAAALLLASRIAKGRRRLRELEEREQNHEWFRPHDN